MTARAFRPRSASGPNWDLTDTDGNVFLGDLGYPVAAALSRFLNAEPPMARDLHFLAVHILGEAGISVLSQDGH